MNREEFEKNWNQLKTKIQAKWNRFTHEDLKHLNGKFEQFLTQLQKKYGYSKEHAEREIHNWTESHHMQKNAPKLWSEKSPSDIQAEKELTHEDKDAIYPMNAQKNEHPKKGHEHKHKKRKAS